MQRYAVSMHPALIDAATQPGFSYDGRTLHFLMGHPPQLHALDLDTGATSRLTDHTDRVVFHRRAPHDERLVYGVDDGSERQALWLLDGVARPLTEAPGVMHHMGAWAHDGRAIAITANDRDPAHFDILTLDVTTGAQTRLAHGRHETWCGGWHRDGTRLLAWAEHATGDVRPYTLATNGTAAPMPRRRATDYSRLRWHHDHWLGLSDASGWMALSQIDPVNGASVPVHAPDCDVEAWSLSHAGLLATVDNDRGVSVLRVGPMDGARPPVPGLPDVITDLAWSPDGTTLAFSANGATVPSGLWLWTAAGVRCVLQPPGLPAVAWHRAEWPSFDGRAIPGWLALPPVPAPAAGWPAIVWVHGGPASEARPTYRADLQAMLANGIAVLMPNVRGSTGSGRAAMEADDHDRRLDAVHDLIAAARWLPGAGIDPARIAVMGQSYGGYMVLAALTEAPDLWRTGIDWYGFSDFGTLLTHTGPWRRAHRAAEYGDPIRHRALFDRLSPLRHVNRIRAPLLVLHGVRDPRVPIGESEQLVDAMATRGLPVAYVAFPGAGHGFVTGADRVRAWDETAAFLRRTL